jgi:hypothetical protein
MSGTPSSLRASGRIRTAIKGALRPVHLPRGSSETWLLPPLTGPNKPGTAHNASPNSGGAGKQSERRSWGESMLSWGRAPPVARRG